MTHYTRADGRRVRSHAAPRPTLLDRLRCWDYLSPQLGVIAGFHVLTAATLLLAPTSQVVTAGTLPVFEIAPSASIDAHRIAWTVVYAIAALLLVAVWRHPTPRRQWTAWLVVIPTGFVWAGVFGLAVIDGAGSALGVVVWATLLAWWGTVAVAVGARSGRTD